MEPLAPLAVTVNGSWARPGWYRLFVDQMNAPETALGPDDRAEAQADALRLTIDDQLRAGVDVISDGEVGRPERHVSVLARLTGLERQPVTRRLGAPGPDQLAHFVCTAPLNAPHGLGLVDEYRRFKELANATHRFCVPGPLLLASAIQGGKVYRNRDAILEVLAPLVNRELRAIVEAGATILQIDEPVFAIEAGKTDLFVRLVERTTAGVRAHTTLHLGFGNDHGRSLGPRRYGSLFPEIGKCAVQELSFEFAGREMAEVELLAQLKPPMGVAVGLVDVRSHWVEPPELIAERLRVVLKQIEPARVRATSDGGFDQTSRPIARAKLTNLVAGVAIVRDERKK